MKKFRQILWKGLFRHIFVLVDLVFMRVDKKFTTLSPEVAEDLRIMKFTPNFLKRSGGDRSISSYSESIGVFKVLIINLLQNIPRPKILDIGCGSGLLAIASESLVRDGGEYIGLDIKESDIGYCREKFKDFFSHSFIHHSVRNAVYAPGQDSKHQPWDILDESIDLVTAKSVWTHLNKKDAIYYFGEVSRVLKPGGKALISFCLLDDSYYQQVNKIKKPWVRYSTPLYDSKDWFTVSNIKIPECCIGITDNGIKEMADLAGLRLVKKYPGQWKRSPGLWGQDILVFEKNV